MQITKHLRITKYPLDCAMHGAINIKTKRWGYICFKWPNAQYGVKFPGYFYISPNATPWAATVLIGNRFSRREKDLAKWRRRRWGICYNTAIFDPQILIPPHLRG